MTESKSSLERVTEAAVQDAHADGPPLSLIGEAAAGISHAQPGSIARGDACLCRLGLHKWDRLWLPYQKARRVCVRCAREKSE